MDPETRAYLDDMRREVFLRFDGIDRRFESVDRRFESIDHRFDAVDRRFDAIDHRFDAIDRRFDATDQRLEAHDQRFEAHDRRFDAIEQTLAANVERTRHLGVVVEDLRRLIQTVAEGVTANSAALTALRAEMISGFEARDAVVRAAFTDVRRDLADLRRRL